MNRSGFPSPEPTDQLCRAHTLEQHTIILIHTGNSVPVVLEPIYSQVLIHTGSSVPVVLEPIYSKVLIHTGNSAPVVLKLIYSIAKFSFRQI